MIPQVALTQNTPEVGSVLVIKIMDSFITTFKISQDTEDKVLESTKGCVIEKF